MKEYGYSDIASINDKGILFSDSRFIKFEECRYRWLKEHNISENDSVCIALRFCEKDKCYFIFYSDEPIKLVFNMKGFIKRKRNINKFEKIQRLINRCGYTSYDMT